VDSENIIAFPLFTAINISLFPLVSLASISLIALISFFFEYCSSVVFFKKPYLNLYI